MIKFNKKNKLSAIFLILAISGFLSAAAQDNHNQDTISTQYSLQKQPVYTTSRLDTDRPVIDGILDDGCWKQGNWAGEYHQWLPEEGAEPTWPTEFNIQYDDKNLYVAVKALEENVAEIEADEEKDDSSVWKDDSIELFMDMELDCFDNWQFIFNSKGTKWDGYRDRRGTIDRDRLDATVERKAKVTDDGWQIEVAIPFAEIDVPTPRSGEVWNFGVQRWRYVTGQLTTTWGNERGEPIGGNPEMFGFLVFE